MSLDLTPCKCGALVDTNRSMDRSGGRTIIVWTCGASSPYDGPGRPCPNRDERTTRDEITQPPEAEEPEAMIQTTETTPATKPSLEQEVAAWSKTDAEIRALVAATEGATVRGHVDGPKKGREVVHGHLMTLTKARTGIEKRKAELKRPALDLCNLIETEAKRLVAITAAREAELRKDRDEWDAEQERLAKAKIQSRLDAMTAAGLPPDLARATDMSDAAWDTYLSAAIDAKAKLDAATMVADELNALEDPCTPAEALQLTDDQIEHRLSVARKADHDRKEAARIKAEEAKAEADRLESKRLMQVEVERQARVRLETGSLRLREMSLLGTPADLDALADMTPEAYAVALETAAQEKEDRDQKARDDAAELDRLRKLATPAPVVHVAPTFEILPETIEDPAPVVAPPTLAEMVAPVVVKAPEPTVSSVEILAWFNRIREAIKATPDDAIDTRAASIKMLATVEEVFNDFLPF